jgi:hypothetical protein
MLRPDDPPLPDGASVDKADGSAFGTIFWAALIIDTAPGRGRRFLIGNLVAFLNRAGFVGRRLRCDPAVLIVYWNSSACFGHAKVPGSTGE